MGVLDFRSIVRHGKVWSAVHVTNREEVQELYCFLEEILLQDEKFLEDAESDSRTASRTLKRFVHLADESTFKRQYAQFQITKHVLWVIISVLVHCNRLDLILSEESLEKLNHIADRSQNLKYLVSPFHTGVHTFAPAILGCYISRLSVLVNQRELPLLDQLIDQLLPNIRHVQLFPVPSQNAPLHLVKTIRHGGVGVIYPEFSYGINQEYETVRWFDGELSVPIGPYLLGRKFADAVIPMSIMWNGSELILKTTESIRAQDYTQKEFLDTLFAIGEEWLRPNLEQWVGWELLADSNIAEQQIAASEQVH